MSDRVDFYYNAYENFTEEVLQAIRRETYGTDIGQNSWLTADKFDRFLSGLRLRPEHHVLEVACGSGGPARWVAERFGCRVTGIDANASGVETATRGAAGSPSRERLTFREADANGRLPFVDDSFDALLCIDSMNHLRAGVFREWHRVLRPGGRAVFTDPVVITGPVTNDELALRSSIGVFLFVPPGVNERLIEAAGFVLVGSEDVSENAAAVSKRRHDARERRCEALSELEGAERFAGSQRFLMAVHGLTAERRLSRIAYLAEKPEASSG